MDEQTKDQEPTRCSASELHDAADPQSSVQCMKYGVNGEHELPHQAKTPSGGVLRWPDAEIAPEA